MAKRKLSIGGLRNCLIFDDAEDPPLKVEGFTVGQVMVADANGEFAASDDVADLKSAPIQSVANMALTLALPFTLDYRGGPNSDGCLVGLLTHSALSACIMEDNSGGPSYVDETTDINSAAAADVTFDPDDTDDAFYFGSAAQFSALVLNLSTGGAGDDVAGETVWEYWNGSTWATLDDYPQDDSSALTAGASTYVLSFQPPTDWATTTVNSQGPYYYIRLRCTANAVFNTTTPVGTQAWVLRLDTGQGVVVPWTCTITGADLTALTASASNNDTIFLLVNKTQGTCAVITWTKADAIDRVTGLTLSVTAGDEIVLQQLQEDGTTEFADGQMILTCEIA